MPLKLTILGSGSAVPTLYRSVSSQYLNFNERRILIDCGEGTQMQLRRYKVKYQRLQFILISHLHGDHYLGLFGLLGSMGLTGRKSKLTIYGPEDLKTLLDLQFKVSKVKLAFEIEFIPLTAETKELIFEDKVLKIFAFPVKHRIPCWGFSFEEKERRSNLKKEKIQEYNISVPEIKELLDGEDLVREGEIIPSAEFFDPAPPPIKFVFCGDTAYNTKILPWIKGADLLYHEATFSEKEVDRATATMHSTAKQAAAIANKAEVGKLLLGHFSARYKVTEALEEEARTIFSNSVCVEDGDEFVV
ncbi:ribonuclease Z [Crocinitomix catalasitica]|nr:ribonuclease Z [Crocinitomix catalasitica]